MCELFVLGETSLVDDGVGGEARCLSARSCSKPGALCVIEQANVTPSLPCAVDRHLISTFLIKNETSSAQPPVLMCSVTPIETVLDCPGVSWPDSVCPSEKQSDGNADQGARCGPLSESLSLVCCSSRSASGDVCWQLRAWTFVPTLHARN